MSTLTKVALSSNIRTLPCICTISCVCPFAMDVSKSVTHGFLKCVCASSDSIGAHCKNRIVLSTKTFLHGS